MGKTSFQSSNKKWILFLPLFIFFSFQNCQLGLKNGNIEDITDTLKSQNGGGGISGNGQGYEGKLLAFERQLPLDQIDSTNTKMNPCINSVFETISYKNNQVVLEKLDLSSCQKKEVSIKESDLNFSHSKMILSHNDGLFVSSQLMAERYLNYHPQVWCQSENINDSVFELLILSNQTNGTLIATMSVYDLNTNFERKVDDFNLKFNFINSTNQQKPYSSSNMNLFYNNDSLQLKIFTSVPKDLKKGNYQAQSLFSLDQKIYNPTLSCYLGHKYDGALWPSTPLLADKIGFNIYKTKNNKDMYIDSSLVWYYSESNKSFLYSSQLDRSQLINFDTKTNSKTFLNVKDLVGQEIHSFKMSLDKSKLLVKTLSVPSLFILLDLETKKILFQSESNIQVTDIGESDLGIWYKGREILSIYNDKLLYKTSENYYYPFGHKITGSDIVFPDHDKFIEFDWIGTNQDQTHSLYEVRLGQSATIINNKWNSNMAISFNCDLAIYNHINNVLYPLKIANQFSGFTLGLTVKNRTAINGNKLYTMIENNSVYRFVSFDFFTNESRTLMEVPKILDSKTNNPINVFYFSYDKLIYLDNRNMFQVLDLKTEILSPLLPALIMNSGKPLYPLISKNYLMYFTIAEDGSLYPIFWDLKKPLYHGPLFHFKHSNLKFQYIETNSYPGVTQFDLNKNGKLILQIDLNFDSQSELYYADYFEESNGFRMISNRYKEYGGVFNFYVYDNDEIYIISELNFMNYIFRWHP